MSDIPWPPSTCAARAKRCQVTLIVQWCADEHGYIGMAFQAGVPLLPQIVGPFFTPEKCRAATERVLYRLGLWW